MLTPFEYYTNKLIKRLKNNKTKHTKPFLYSVRVTYDAKMKENVAIIDEQYIITQHGDVYKLSENGEWKVLAKRKHSNGYLRVAIYRHDFYIHRLVAMCFIPNWNPIQNTEISHEDNDKTNNDVTNLVWCDRNYNERKKYKDGITNSEYFKKISQTPRMTLRKFDDSQIQKIREYMQSGMSHIKISKIMGCARQTIDSIARGSTYARNSL